MYENVHYLSADWCTGSINYDHANELLKSISCCFLYLVLLKLIKTESLVYSWIRLCFRDHLYICKLDRCIQFSCRNNISHNLWNWSSNGSRIRFVSLLPCVNNRDSCLHDNVYDKKEVTPNQRK